MIVRRSRAALLAATALLPLAFSPVLVAPASAQWIVYDPTNYAQNVLQAALRLTQTQTGSTDPPDPIAARPSHVVPPPPATRR